MGCEYTGAKRAQGRVVTRVRSGFEGRDDKDAMRVHGALEGSPARVPSPVGCQLYVPCRMALLRVACKQHTMRQTNNSRSSFPYKYGDPLSCDPFACHLSPLPSKWDPTGANNHRAICRCWRQPAPVQFSTS